MTAPAPPARQPRNDVLNSAVGQLLHRLESYVPTESRKGDRGKLAKLRRGAGKRLGEANDAMMVFFGDTPANLYDDEADDLYTVATLFACHPEDGDPVPIPRSRAERGFGASLAAIRLREGGAEEDEGVTRRFTALLNARADSLPYHLRQLIALLHSRAKNTPVDYRQLFFDLRDWDSPDRRVQRSWATGFWRRGAPAIDEPASANANDDGTAATTDQED